MIKLSGKKRIAIAVASLLCLVCLIAGGATMTVPTAQAATDKTIAEFLSTFTGTKNASVTTEEGILRIGVTGDNGYAEVLTDSYGSGSQWYVKYLTTRNTVMLRMRNDSPARSMKIYFKTRTKAFASSRYIELPLETDGEWHTYFADFSANAEATGELRGLRFRPECSSGSVYIRHISFERETPCYEYAGSVSSCTADGDFVTGKGTRHDHDALVLDLKQAAGVHRAREIFACRKDRFCQSDGGEFRIFLSLSRRRGNDVILQIYRCRGG